MLIIENTNISEKFKEEKVSAVIEQPWNKHCNYLGLVPSCLGI